MNKCRYNSIKDFDINQSEGISVSLWMQGCEHHCEGCYNKDTWDFNKGYEFTYETIDKIINLLTKDNIHKNLSILGGESLSPNKIEMITYLVKKVKEVNCEIKIWIWSGYLFDDIKHLDLINYIDVLVDGKYNKKLHNPTRYKGSDNQKVYDVKNTLLNGYNVFYE